MLDQSILTLEVTHDADMWGNGTPAVFFGMVIDGALIDDASIDPDVFFDAVMRGGRHALLMCPTGAFECCGSFATTRCGDDGLLIGVEQLLPTVAVSWSSVIVAASAMLDELDRGFQASPECYVPSRAADLAAGLARYREYFERLVACRGTVT